MKNHYEVLGNKTTIFIHRRGYGEIRTVVDTSDLPRLLSYDTTWNAKWEKKTQSFYVRNSKSIYLARFILDPEPGLLVDHINHDTLDNRRSNLRAIHPAINSLNRRTHTSVTPGAYQDPGKRGWRAQIHFAGKYVFLGRYKTADEAMAAYRAALDRVIDGLAP